MRDFLRKLYMTGDFWGGGNQVSLAYWTGKDSSALFDGCTHQYATYSEAKAEYYLAIRRSLQAQFPGNQS